MQKGTHKGEATRQAILDRAVGLASQRGLGGLSIGALAEELALSKSGLFAHFKSIGHDLTANRWETGLNPVYNSQAK